MVLDWSTKDDFSSVVDTLESVRHLTRGLPDKSQNLQAWRYSEHQSDASNSDGSVVQTEVVWQLQFTGGAEAVSVDDLIIDEQGISWSIAVVEQLRGATRQRCLSRRSDFKAGLAERFALQRPIYESSVEGDTVVGWSLVLPALKGVVTNSTVFNDATHTGYFVSAITCQVGDRLAGAKGVSYIAIGTPSRDSIGSHYHIPLVIEDAG